MRRPLKILVIGADYPFQTFLARLFDGLLSKGMVLMLASAEKPSEKWLKKPNFIWIHAPAWNARSVGSYLLAMGRIVQILASYKIMGPILKKNAPTFSFYRWIKQAYLLAPFLKKEWDIVYFAWNNSAAVYEGLFDFGFPGVVSCRGRQINIDPILSSKKEIEQSLNTVFSKAAVVHCVSRHILNEAEKYGLDPSKAKIIYPAVDTAIFKPREMRRDNYPIIIVSTGALIWRKGYEHALAAIQKLKEQGMKVRYNIIGEGPEREHLEFSIHDLGLKNEVSLLGKLNTEEVLSHLLEADLFLHASVSEGVANSVLEAMACELAVVTTDSGGMREAITDGVEGLVVPPRDAEAIAKSLRRLAEDKALRVKLGKAARERVDKNFNLSQQIDQFENLFNQVKL